MKKIVYTKNAPDPVGPYSQAILTNNTLFISGQVALDPNNGGMINNSIEEETIQVMNNLKAILNEVGFDFSNVIKSTIYLSDMNNFSKVNELDECLKNRGMILGNVLKKPIEGLVNYHLKYSS
jgi:2-iminobutanoate/2-iminopropanoate deaminase